MCWRRLLYQIFQSTPPARGATAGPICRVLGVSIISIHAPREGGDTVSRTQLPKPFWISIHAPREGGDLSSTVVPRPTTISIHAPREGGDCGTVAGAGPAGISIHAPREGGDLVIDQVGHRPDISIHAPREGGDRGHAYGADGWTYFNPRPPRGGRLPFAGVSFSGCHYFNPRPPRGGRLYQKQIKHRCTRGTNKIK